MTGEMFVFIRSIHATYYRLFYMNFYIVFILML